MTQVNPRQFIDDQIPLEYRGRIATTLQTAYQTARRVWEEESWLQTPSAEYQHGRLVALAVDFGLVRLIETGVLPFDYSWEFFAKPTGKYLAIRPSHSVLTVSQIADPVQQPRNVIFRENRRLNNQPFFDLAEFADEITISGEPHLILTHGYQNLNFAHLSVPDPVHANGYSYRTDNLMNLPREIEMSGPAPENTDTDFENHGLLKEDIARWRRDHGSE
ncbi:MAG: hypothetical protein JWL66_832 [Sphingomonadales bacterium]|nr:hypothetical protein [Sphingomonadales bacterium]